MDVARSLPDRLKEDGIDQPDDRSFIGRIEQILRFIQLMRQLVEILARGNVLHDLLCAGRAGNLVVGPIEAIHQRHRAGEHRFHRHTQEQPQIVERRGFQRIGRGHHDGPVFHLQRKHPIAA